MVASAAVTSLAEATGVNHNIYRFSCCCTIFALVIAFNRYIISSVLAVNAGVVNTAPTNATSVKVALVYQVNTGLVTVVLLAVNTAADPPQTFVEPFTTGYQ